MRSLLLVLAAGLLIPSLLGAQRSLPGDPQITYWELGDTAAPHTIIVLHGGPAVSHDYLRPEWDRLSGARRVVFYDQRGCGQSGPAESYAWSDHVEDLHRLIERVSPGVPVVLAGSSWGGTLATLYATRYPEDVRAMVLSGMPGPRSRQQRVRFLPRLDVPTALKPLIPARGSAGLVPAFQMPLGLQPFRRAPTTPPRSLLRVRPDNGRAARDRAELMELLRPRFSAECADVSAATIESLTGTPQPSVHGFAVPVLFFPDNIFTREFSASATLPDVEGNVTTIIGGGHDPWFRYPEIFFGLVERFLSQV